MTATQIGIRADKVVEMTQSTSALNTRAGPKMQRIGEDVLDLVPDEWYDDDAAGTTDASGEAEIEVSTEFEDLAFAIVQARGNDRFTNWEPHIVDSILEHGAVSGGPFVKAETVTGGSSGATAVVTAVGTDRMQVGAITGTFENGETITGGTSSATATLTHPTAAAAADPAQAERQWIHFSAYDLSTGLAVPSASVDVTWLAKGTTASSTS